MEEAYTIGIRLALEDGVSSGISAISGDLAALDRVVAGSNLRLAGLRDVGSRAIGPVAAHLRPEAGRGEKPAVAATGEVATQAAPTVTKAASAPLPVVGLRPVATTMPPHEAPQVAAAPGLPGPPPLPRFSAFAPVHWQPAPKVAVPADIVTTPPRQTQPDETRPVVRKLASAPPVADPASSVMAQMVVPAAAVPVAVGAAAVTAPWNSPAGAGAAAPVAPTMMGTPAPSVEGPAGQAPMAPTAVPAPHGAAAASATHGSASSPTGGGPSQGDVFLDGVRVGRWMAKTLAREAARPQAGSTFFDARMAPAWPGTLQGG